jgi:hypothetical protein
MQAPGETDRHSEAVSTSRRGAGAAKAENVGLRAEIVRLRDHSCDHERVEATKLAEAAIPLGVGAPAWA